MQNVAFSGKVKKGGNLKWILLCVFLAVAIAGAVIVVVLASTGKTFPEIPQTEEEKAPVFTLGDATATYDLYRFYFLGHKHLLSGGNDAYFDEMDTDSVFAEIDADVREDIAYLYAMFAFAAQLGVTEKEIDELYEELLRMTKSGGEFAGTTYLGYKSEEEYRKSLAANHMNDAVYRLTLRAYAAEYKATERFAATA